MMINQMSTTGPNGSTGSKAAARVNLVHGFGDIRVTPVPTWGGWISGRELLDRVQKDSIAVQTDHGPTIVGSNAWVFLPDHVHAVPLPLPTWVERLLQGPGAAVVPTIIASGATADITSAPSARWIPASDRTIEAMLSGGRLKIAASAPMPMVQPCGIDVRLGGFLILVSDGRHQVIEAEPGFEIVVEPGQLLLGHTLESFTVAADVRGVLQGRSSLARQGIAIHRGSNMVQPGSRGWIALEITVAGGPRRLTVGDYVGNLSIERLDSPCSQPYGSRKERRFHRGELPAALVAHVGANGNNATNGNGHHQPNS